MSKKIQTINPDSNKTVRVQLKDGSDLILPDVAGGLVYSGTVSFACNVNVTGGSLSTSSCFIGRGSIPLGSVIATSPHLAGAYNCTATTVADSQGFVQCNGQVIADGTSPMNGVTVPNINNNVFLAGNTTSGSTGGTNSYAISSAMLPPHTHTIDHTHSAFTSPGPGTASTVATPASTTATPAGSGATDPGLASTSATSGGITAAHTHPGGTTGSGGNHDHCYLFGSCVGCNIQNSSDGTAYVTCNGSTSASTSSCTWNHTHGGSSGNQSANHTHDMSHVHAYPHAHTMPHTHTIPHTHSMPHTHSVTAPFTGPSGNGGFANSAVENRPAYITVKYITRIK